MKMFVNIYNFAKMSFYIVTSELKPNPGLSQNGEYNCHERRDCPFFSIH